MATVASGLNSGSGFGSSDTITSTTLNNHVNFATVTNILTADIADSSSKTTGVTFAKMQHISTEKLVGRTSSNEGDIEEVDIVGASGILLDEDTLSSDSNTRGATQQSIKAYVDDKALDPTRGYHSTSFSTTDDTIQQNTTGRPLLINFGLKSNDEIGLLRLRISTNSDMSSPIVLSIFTIKSDGVNPSRATVSGVVPATYYWQVTQTSISSGSEEFHIGFKL